MARKKKAQGLGDTIENVLETTGIANVVKSVFGENCGCEERKEALNKLWTYKKVECINETDMVYLNEFFKDNHEQLSIKHQTQLKSIYKNIFNINLESTSCSSCWRDYIGQIKQVYDLSV